MEGTPIPAHETGRPTRRAFMRLGAAVGAASGLLGAACGTGGSGSSGNTAQPAPRALDKSQRDELLWVVWSSDGGLRKEAYDSMVKRFNEQFPNVTVTRVAGGGETLEKLTTLFASDTRVDIVGTRPDALPSYMQGLNPLQDLKQFTRKDGSVVKESDHIQGVVDALTWKGALYALPVGVYTNHAVINIDLLKQKGLSTPAAGWNIDQALEMARKITERKETEQDSTWGFNHHWAVTTNFPSSWIRGNGGEPMTPNDNIAESKWSTDRETINTVEWLHDLSHKLGVMSVEPFGGVWGGFREGRLGIGIMETNNLYQIVDAQQKGGAQFAWDVYPLPQMKKGTYQPIGGFAYGLSRNTKNPDVTWELLKQVVGPAGQTDWFKLAKFAPSIKSLMNGAYLQDKEPPGNKKAIIDALNASKPMPTSPRWAEVDKAVVTNLAKIRSKEVSVNQGLATIDQQVKLAITGR